jgi:general secretion pathway protein F
MLFWTLLRPVVQRGLPLSEALRAMRGEGGDAEVMDAMAREVDEGSQLSETLERRPEIFPAPVPALIAVGQRAGDMTAAIDHCIRLSGHRMRLNGHLRAGLVYPTICLLLVLGISIVHVFLTSTEPFGDFLSRAFRRPPTFPFLAEALGILVALGATAMAVGMWLLFFSPNRTVSKDRALLNLPVVGRLYRLSVAASFTRALGALLDGGIPIDRAVKAAIPAAPNAWARSELTERLAGVEDGESLSDALSLPGVFPPSLRWRLAVGEERGTLPEALRGAADAYEEELAVCSGRLARMVEPAGVIVVGLLAMLVVWLWFGRLQMVANLDYLGIW